MAARAGGANGDQAAVWARVWGRSGPGAGAGAGAGARVRARLVGFGWGRGAGGEGGRGWLGVRRGAGRGRPGVRSVEGDEHDLHHPVV